MHHPQDGLYTAPPQHFSQRWSMPFSPTLPNPISSCLKASTWRGNSWLSQRRSSSFLLQTSLFACMHPITWKHDVHPIYLHTATEMHILPCVPVAPFPCSSVPSGCQVVGPLISTRWSGRQLDPRDICTKIWGTSVYVIQITALPHSCPLHDWRDTDILPTLSHILTCFVFPFTFSKVSPIGFGSTFHFWLFWPLFCALFFS